MRYEERKNLFRTIIIGLLYLIFLYITCKYQWDKGFITINEITSINVFKRFIQDFIILLFFPFILLLRYHKNLSELGFTSKSKNLCIILFIIYLLFFILHSDYTIGGFYRAVFYLLTVGFSEEIIMRGYFYLRIKPINKVLAIIFSGIIFGATHAILPGIIADKNMSFIVINMLNYIGGGIVGGLLFIYCMELSGNILVAILVHSLLDYSYGILGILVLVITLGYLIFKNKEMKIS